MRFWASYHLLCASVHMPSIVIVLQSVYSAGQLPEPRTGSVRPEHAHPLFHDKLLQGNEYSSLCCTEETRR